jgi:UrcA family protein
MALDFRFANVALHKQRKDLTMKHLKTVLMFAIAACSVNSAQAASAPDGESFRLKAYELETAEGRKKLLARMKSKAASACISRSYSFHQDTDACKKDLQTQWIAAIGNPALAALVRKGKDSFASASN